jgi:hypothetical protein
MSCSWWQIPIRSGPLLGINCPTLTFQSPLTPSHPLGQYYIITTTSTISVFLIWNKYTPIKEDQPCTFTNKERIFFEINNKPHVDFKFCALLLELGADATVSQKIITSAFWSGISDFRTSIAKQLF